MPGSTVEQLDAFVDLYAAAPAAVLVWSMGITQHRHGVEGVQGIVNVGLARGNVGRDGAGLMPIRGHSGVQGGAEMGAYATALPGGLPVDAEHAAALGEQWGFDVPPVPGLTATEQVEAAERGELDVLYVDGGNFLEVLPDPAAGGAGVGTGAAAGPPGRDAVEPDAGRGRRRDPPARRHPLRAGGWRHRDHHRAPGGVQPRDPPAGR